MDDPLEERREMILGFFELALDTESQPLRITLIVTTLLAASVLVTLGLLKVPVVRAFAFVVPVAILIGLGLHTDLQPRYDRRFRDIVVRCCRYAQEQGLNADDLLAYWQDFIENQRFFAALVSRIGSSIDSDAARDIPKLILSYDSPGWKGLKNGGLPYPDHGADEPA